MCILYKFVFIFASKMMGFNLHFILSDVLIQFQASRRSLRRSVQAAKRMIRVWICGPSDPWLAVKTGMMLCELYK